ncbi:hypothetical protein AAJ76_2150001580 [Vairimorpha ceranae]|uniref:Uncharacterized protein n=1 Tax=Vairimorpha ceranae TaxID=40302 RepID=A0A0F9Z7B9_9MICR|nr:hypothetical protein AAJ76_2150001580 [Vairimorpha ceranae]KKO73829.1 hypothetical protein AAJ76_2150001580 [Vairimorpha ceranae]
MKTNKQLNKFTSRYFYFAKHDILNSDSKNFQGNLLLYLSNLDKTSLQEKTFNSTTFNLKMEDDMGLANSLKIIVYRVY